MPKVTGQQTTAHRPQSRNFKAEREARAKEQNAKRAQDQRKGNLVNKLRMVKNVDRRQQGQTTK